MARVYKTAVKANDGILRDAHQFSGGVIYQVVWEPKTAVGRLVVNLIAKAKGIK